MRFGRALDEAAARRADTGAGRVGLLGPRRRGSAHRAGRAVRVVRRSARGRRGARPRRPRAGPGRAVRAGRPPQRRRDRDPVEVARQPGRRGAGAAGPARAPGQPGATVHLRHRPGPGVDGRRAGRAPGAAGPARAVHDGPRPGANAGRRTRRRDTRRRGALDPDAVAAGRGRCAGGGPGRGHPGRLLPAAVGARRDLPAARHRERRHPRGRTGTARSTSWSRSPRSTSDPTRDRRDGHRTPGSARRSPRPRWRRRPRATWWS